MLKRTVIRSCLDRGILGVGGMSGATNELWVSEAWRAAQLLRIRALLAWSLERTQLIQVPGQERGSVSKSPGGRVRRTEGAHLPAFSSSTASRGHYPEKLWKILKQMGIPDHPTCLFRNLYAVQEATGRTGHGTTDWFQRSTSRLYIVTLLI